MFWFFINICFCVFWRRNQWEFEGSESSSSCDSDEEIYQKYDSSNDEDANEQQNHEQLESKLKEIREFRNKGRVPMSLALLSIKTVTNNCSKFIDTPHSPLKYLRQWRKFKSTSVLFQLIQLCSNFWSWLSLTWAASADSFLIECPIFTFLFIICVIFCNCW